MSQLNIQYRMTDKRLTQEANDCLGGVPMKVWMLVLLTFSCSAFSSEFTHIKLKPDFEEYLTQTRSKSNSLKSKSKASNAQAGNAVEDVFKRALLGATPDFKSDINTPIPVDGEESLLYEEIRRHLQTAHSQIGADQVQQINRFNQQFNLGTSNFSGFSWQKPFGVVQVYVDRQVTPNILGQKQDWLVMDSFTFSIEASTFLEKLNESGLTNMNSMEIGAFAGITFKRVYTYWHYANSYQDGLQSDFTKLFLPFTKFNTSGMETMADQEIMKREDLWTASGGGLITTPPVYNMSLSAGVLSETDFQNVTSIENNLKENQRFKVGVLSKKSAMLGATVELQLDFFKLIKFSLLRYDLNYEYSSGKEFTLGFTNNQFAQIKENNEQGDEFRSILRGFGSVKKLEPYVVRLDESSSSEQTQRGSILIWGKLQKSKTEQIRVIKDNTVHLFLKNYAQNVKVVQDIFSRIFSAIIYKLLKLPIGATNAAIYSRQLIMEYHATHPQAADPKIARIDSTEQFSFILTQYYNAARTDRWIDKKYKKDIIWFVENFTTLPITYKMDIRNEILKGPMMVESNLRVERAGFQYILATDENDIFGKISKVCESKRTSEWMQEISRREMLEQTQLGPENCVKNMGLKYLSFKSDYVANLLKPSIAMFKDFITQYYKEAGNIAELQSLFGAENTFINGRLQASTSMGMPFNTVFSSGQFRGLGVIDNFKRSNGSRMPASIPSE